MESAYEKYYERQPAAVKVIAVAGIGLLGYSVYRHFKKQQDERDALIAAEEAQKELNALSNAGVHPSYSESEYINMVHALVQAMNGCGTDEDAVYEVFQLMNNEADVRKLITSFGLQYYEPCAAESPFQYAVWQFNKEAYGGDLSTWLHYDLSTAEINEINGILSSKGISYKF